MLLAIVNAVLAGVSMLCAMEEADMPIIADIMSNLFFMRKNGFDFEMVSLSISRYFVLKDDLIRRIRAKVSDY